MGKKNIKQHLKDIDWRSRKQRQLNWEEDFWDWHKELGSRSEPYALVQAPLLESFIGFIYEDPESAIEHIELTKAQADFDTDEGWATFYLCNSVLWYLR